jgi:CRP/FNR family transcriptional regulator, cyclic AMP receptor protein
MAAQAPARTLDGIGLLADLSPGERQALARRCSWRRPRDREQVIAHGAESREVLFVVAGRLRVVYHAPSGREIAYAYRERGVLVGELGVLDGGPRSASVEADGDCLLAALPAAAFLELLDRHPVVARRLLVHLAGVVRAVSQKAAEFGLVGAVQRVHRELLRLARPAPGGGAVVAPLPTQEELAASVGTTRETAARALAQLAKAGIARRRRRELLIREPRVLEALASVAD